MAKELPDNIYEVVKRLSREGDEFAKAGDYAQALAHYQRAWDQLPQPRGDWLAATWLLAAIGDAHFLGGDFIQALKAFTDAVQGPQGLGNPFLHLRRGECLFELGEKADAADELMRAYMGGGHEIFDTEKPEYLQYLGTVAKL
jgi:tetratricopeptide (TPR) repeat protein